MLTENQQTVYDWINDELELPVYAEAYKGAIEQLNNKSSGYITFVSHTGRDIMNGLAADAEDIPRTRVQYEQHLDKFKDKWQDEWGGEVFNSTEDIKEKKYLVPNEICKSIKELVDEHKGRLRAEGKVSLFFTAFLGYSNTEIIPDDRIKVWRDTKKFFDKHAHSRKKRITSDNRIEGELHFQSLDNFLYDAATNVIRQLRSVHEILEETNQ